MAISSGVRQHAGWLEVGGQRWLAQSGTVHLASTRESSSFSVKIPMSLPGALDFFASPDSTDAKVIVLAGFTEQTLFTGEMDNCEFGFVNRMLHVTGRCKSVKLHQKKTSDKWQNKQPGDIIQDLAQRAGLNAEIGACSLKAGRRWNQDWVKLTDTVGFSAAIHKLSEFMGMRWWVDANGMLHVQPDGSGAGTYTVFYDDSMQPIQSDALRLSVRKNYEAGKTTTVSVKSWNQKKKKIYSAEKTAKGQAGDLRLEQHVAGLDQDHTDQWAKSKLNDHIRHELGISIECVGDPACVAGMQLQLIGTPFAQTYEIDEVQHSFGMGGYRMTISARNPKEGRTAE